MAEFTKHIGAKGIERIKKIKIIFSTFSSKILSIYDAVILLFYNKKRKARWRKNKKN
jgi:hypothetical protein